MSLKPAEFETALRQLRDEPIPEGLGGRVRNALQPRPRRSFRLVAVLATSVVAAALFWPRPSLGEAWAQAVQRSTEMVPNISTHRNKDGRIGLIEWRSGIKRAFVLYDRTGRPMMESRSDGKRSFISAGRLFRSETANDRPWALVSDGNFPDIYRPLVGSLESLLNEKSIRVLEHRETSQNQPESYRLEVRSRYATKPIVYEATVREGMISSLRDSTGSQVEIQYPPSLAASVFDPRPQTIRNVAVYDLPKIADKVERDLREGLGRKGPVTLRSVLLTGGGDLWVFWSGARPDARLSKPFRVVGVPCGYPFSNKEFTGPEGAKSSPWSGMARVPKVKIGDRISLEIPYPGGVARFERVPVTRIGLIQHVQSLLRRGTR